MLTQINDLGLDMEVVKGSENEGSPYGFAVFSEDGQELIDRFNAGLANIIADGTYEEIIEKYLGEEAAENAVANMVSAGVSETEAE